MCPIQKCLRTLAPVNFGRARAARKLPDSGCLDKSSFPVSSLPMTVVHAGKDAQEQANAILATGALEQTRQISSYGRQSQIHRCGDLLVLLALKHERDDPRLLR